jgi:hypothetical protein
VAMLKYLHVRYGCRVTACWINGCQPHVTLTPPRNCTPQSCHGYAVARDTFSIQVSMVVKTSIPMNRDVVFCGRTKRVVQVVTCYAVLEHPGQ